MDIYTNQSALRTGIVWVYHFPVYLRAMKPRFPGVSFVIATLNAHRTLRECLKRVANQKYPKKRYEVLIVDGGSSDDTLQIVNSFSGKIPVRVIHAGLPENMEGRRLAGFKQAKFGVICELDSDNYLGGNDWLSRMMEPLEADPGLVGSFTLHYHYAPTQTLFNRYVALFGGHDPVSYYLRKTDRLKWTSKKWGRRSQIVSANPRYTVVKFSQSDFPTLGCNGFLIRKSFLRIKDMPVEKFFHTDILYDLLDNGLNRYAVVDVPLTHDTGSTLSHNIKKRIMYMSLHHVKLVKNRRYKVFNSASPKDVLNLALFVLFTITLVVPVIEAVWGYLKLRDKAWFLHPVACVAFLIGYGYVSVKSRVEQVWR